MHYKVNFSEVKNSGCDVLDELEIRFFLSLLQKFMNNFNSKKFIRCKLLRVLLFFRIREDSICKQCSSYSFLDVPNK